MFVIMCLIWIWVLIAWLYVILALYLFTVGKSVWFSALEFKLKALSATETEIAYTIVIGVIFRAYGEI